MTQVSATYTYDSGTNGKGRRTGMSDGSGSTSWTYDTRGRMLSESKTITGAGTFDTSWTYNSADLPITMKYPDDEVVTNNYDNRMLLNSVIGAASYVSSTSYDSAGRVDLRTFGNNIQTDYIYYPWSTQGGRLQFLNSGTSGTPTSLQSLEYAYDAAGSHSYSGSHREGLRSIPKKGKSFFQSDRNTQDAVLRNFSRSQMLNGYSKTGVRAPKGPHPCFRTFSRYFA